jgi:hypothetical protein
MIKNAYLTFLQIVLCWLILCENDPSTKIPDEDLSLQWYLDFSDHLIMNFRHIRLNQSSVHGVDKKNSILCKIPSNLIKLHVSIGQKPDAETTYTKMQAGVQ